MAWSDERLDDLAQRMDAGFARVDSELLELRREMHTGFERLENSFNRLSVGMILALVSLLAAILARG